MRVLIVTRPEVFEHFGGEAVQIMETSKALAALGVDATVTTDLRPDCSGYNVVHLFNLTMVAETYQQALHARTFGKPLVLSTIYFSWDEFERCGRRGALRLINRFLSSAEPRQRLKALAKTVLSNNSSAHWQQFLRGYQWQQKQLLKMVSVLLPNSWAEAEAIEHEFGPLPIEYQVVPNGVDPAWLDSISGGLFFSRYGLRDFLLCVGRIDERKNQLALIDSLSDTKIPMVFIGGVSPRHKSYVRDFLRRIKSAPNIWYLGPLEHDMVISAMKVARVHALPSWLETPGLTSLEAGLVGCRIVTTDRGGPTEYFADQAWYCQPNDRDSIRRAVLSAWNADATPGLRQRIIDNFTWEVAAQKTLAAYQRAMALQG